MLVTLQGKREELGKLARKMIKEILVEVNGKTVEIGDDRLEKMMSGLWAAEMLN